MVITQTFENLSLDQYSGTDEFADITQKLQELCQHLDPSSVVKEPSFSLFEGTYALEVCNQKLDTSLISLSKEEAEFNCDIAYGSSEAEQLVYVTSVCDRLCRSVMNWLHDYQTLPTTVLSCRYVEEIIGKYTAAPSRNLNNIRLQTGSQFYDQVLYSCVIAVCSFVKFTSKLLQAGVVYEEEDLNCNVMGLNMLSEIDDKQVLVELSGALDFLENSPLNCTHVRNILLICQALLHIPQYCPKTTFEISNDLTLLASMDSVLSQLENTDFLPKVPSGCFSKGIQKRRNNNFPPKELYEPKGIEYQYYKSFFEDIQTVVSVFDSSSAFEIRQFAWFFNRIKQRNVLARALLPLYLIHDDGMVLGLYPFRNFTEMHLFEFSLTGTALGERLKDDMQFYTEVEPYFTDISNCLFEWYQNMSQNVCRHRQGFNRQLLVWDSLQASLQQFETELEEIGMKDEISQDSDASLLPLTTWVYTNKLLSMIEFVLEGFHLEVYKPWESFSQYWFTYYLANHLESNLQRLHQFLTKKIGHIVGLNKKLKKLKAGDKKQRAKENYKHLATTQLPQLQANDKRVSFLFMECTILKSLSLVQTFQFAILKSYGLIDSKSPVKNNFCSNEAIHELRFKTFSTIGIPEIPSYDQFQKSLQDFVIEPPSLNAKTAKAMEFMDHELENAKIAIKAIIKAIKSEEDENNSPIHTDTKLVKGTALEWYKSLQNSAKALALNASVISKKTENKKLNSKDYRIELHMVPDGCHHFPLLTLVPTSRAKT